MWSTSIGVIMPIAYLLSEGLVTRIDEPEVLVIALTSIPFWLLLTLFILQVFSNTHYLQKLASTEHSDAVKELYLLREIFNMALSNTLIAVSGFALTPIFLDQQASSILRYCCSYCLCHFYFSVFVSTHDYSGETNAHSGKYSDERL